MQVKAKGSAGGGMGKAPRQPSCTKMPRPQGNVTPAHHAAMGANKNVLPKTILLLHKTAWESNAKREKRQKCCKWFNNSDERIERELHIQARGEEPASREGIEGCLVGFLSLSNSYQGEMPHTKNGPQQENFSIPIAPE